jgi:hypothetical protein
MRPILSNEKRRKMVSFMISPECVEILENMLSTYKEKIFKRFTKTDLFEMGIKHLAQDLNKKNIIDLYNKYIEEKITN